MDMCWFIERREGDEGKWLVLKVVLGLGCAASGYYGRFKGGLCG